MLAVQPFDTYKYSSVLRYQLDCAKQKIIIIIIEQSGIAFPGIVSFSAYALKMNTYLM